MKLNSCLYLLIVALISFNQLPIVRCDVDIITKICRHPDCSNLDKNDPKYSGQRYYRQLYELFSSGIGHLIHRNVDELLSGLDRDKVEVTKKCRDHLKTVGQGIDQGQDWAFRLIDSSGKTPSAFLSGTVTTLGDYDECLALHSPDLDIVGKYCLIDVFPRVYGEERKRRDEFVSLNSPQHFNASAYYIGLCFPSGCSSDDVRSLVKHVLKPFPLLVEGHMHCDTKESISYLTRLLEIRVGPLISLLFLGVIFAMVGYATSLEVLRLSPYADMRTMAEQRMTPTVKSFSLWENFNRLFWVANKKGREEIIDWFKWLAITFGVFAHIMCCLESPLGFFMLSHHGNLETIISNPLVTPLFNEAGFLALTVLGGMATFMFAYQAEKRGRLQVAPAMLDRVLRHLPGVAAIMALDFTWYLWFSGPLYSRVGKVLVDKCTKTWWKNFLFVSNLWGESIEICAGHTFFSSVDVQLFLLGLLAVKLLVHRPRIGVSFCLGMIALGNALMYYFAVVRDLTPNLMVARDPYIHNLEEFLFHIHMSTWGAFPSYFFGLVLTYSVSQGHWRFLQAPKGQQLNHLFWISAFVMAGNCVQYMPILHNALDILPKALIPMYICGVRMLVLLQMGIFIVYFSLLSEKVQEAANSKDHNQNSSKDIANEPQGSYSPLKALCRLSFSIYLSNYYFIRTDFFTERTVYYNTLYHFIKRLVSSFVFILITALIFQLVILGPFTNLRNLLLHSPRQKKPEAKKAQ